MATVVEQTHPPFRNEVVRTFADPHERAAQAAAIERFLSESERRYPIVIGAERLTPEPPVPSVTPADPSRHAGWYHEATPQLADRAVAEAEKAFAAWSRVPWGERADLLFRAAAALRARKDEFNAAMIVETGKPWVEADADTAEAIDFLEYYARDALKLGAPQPIVPSPLPEDNWLEYLPLGVGAILPPWNFPLAIMAGMTTAAIVTGNTVVLKPSPDATVIAARFVDLLIELGLPPGVVNFLPGGAEVGERLVEHPRTRFISFTGSMAVGLHINEVAAKPREGQIWIKRVVAEMGGKDAVVVAADADLDAAADGIVASAFGFQGQKCSAASRAIIEESVYDAVRAKVLERMAKLEIGDPAESPTVDVGPVINERSYQRILKAIARGVEEGGHVMAGGKAVDRNGYFIQPTIVENVTPEKMLAQEEIFGPVCAFIKARDFDHALEIANGTKYGLTGALYSKDPAKIDRAAREFHVGNLYLNRKCTGALVGVHPFGGFNLSGTDSKAGGHDYLLLFVQAKSIARKR
ncbi:MAG TPA: L-glutamate gamma-semialdehyde dehydrogenase [Candidatus Dormibacteraeota bacterium]|nr:L-glutamate gamma-semialdehyde dehydrogenase [Candidatus Dormibacteraeota bacterium]